jgi:hypothetical protein
MKKSLIYLYLIIYFHYSNFLMERLEYAFDRLLFKYLVILYFQYRVEPGTILNYFNNN